MFSSLRRLLLFLFFFVVMISGVQAATVTVTKIADTNDGTCDADCSLREAITAATTNTDDTIDFTAGLDGGTITLTSTLQLTNGKNLTIMAPSKGLTIKRDSEDVLYIKKGSGVLTITLKGVTITGNSVGDGIELDIMGTGGKLVLENCTISGKSVGLNVTGNTSYFDIIHSTITANATGIQKAGSGGTNSIKNSIIAGNTKDFVKILTATNIPSGDYNLLGCSTTNPSNDCSPFTINTSLDITGVITPKIDSLASVDGSTLLHRLQSSSQAIGKIPSASCLPTDQRGNTRPSPATPTNCDIGAYEYGNTLKITTAGTGSGTTSTSLTPVGSDDCGSSPDKCLEYKSGVSVTLSATANAGSVFTGWTGDADCTDGTVTMSTNVNCTANFTPGYKLTINSSLGTFTWPSGEIAGVSCGTNCKAYPTSPNITLPTISSIPTGSEFKDWTAVTGTCPTSSFALSANTECTANFKHNLSVTKAGTGTGTITFPSGSLGSCTGTDCQIYASGTFTLSATPNSDSQFISWGGDCNASGQVTLNAVKNCTATFNLKPKLTLNQTSGGTISASPAGTSCDPGCTAHDSGTSIILSYTLDVGRSFGGWSSGCSNSFSLTADTTCSATFSTNPVLTISPPTSGKVTATGIDCGSGGTDCSQDYVSGTDVTLTATPPSGATTVWGGACSGTSPTTTVTVDSSKTCSVQFGYTLNVNDSRVSFPLYLSECTTPSTTCKVYLKDSSVILGVTDGGGSVFTGWSGTGCTTGTVTVNADKSCTANFTPGFKLTRGTPAGGIISFPSTPAWISSPTCNDAANCRAYASGANVTLIQASTDGLFVGWAGDPECISGNGSVVMNADKFCSANFGESQKLTISIGGQGTGVVNRSPVGSNCGTNCYSYVKDSTVAISPSASSGSEFTGWSGACAGSQSSFNLTMNEDKSCTANFRLNPPPDSHLKLDVKFTGTGKGKIDAGTMVCDANCSGYFPRDQLVTITATPDNASLFEKWTGDCTPNATTANKATVTMDNSHTCYVSFKTAPTGKLSVKKEGTGKGSIVSQTLTGINCGSDCSEAYPLSTKVKLIAAADTGSVFSGWSGDCDAQGNVTVDDDKTCIATFIPTTSYKLVVTQEGTGKGTIATSPAGLGIDCGTDCVDAFPLGTTVKLTATAEEGSRFDGWKNDCGNGSAIMNMDRQCTAVFTALPTYALTVAKNGTGTGTITSNIGGINCGAQCTGNYVKGEDRLVTLTPIADPGSIFTVWSGDGDCADGSITMNTDKTCTATFMPVYAVNVSLDGTGSGRITSDPSGIDCGNTCGTYVASGNQINLIATANDGSSFSHWSGDTACSTGQIKVTKAIQCIANFMQTGSPKFASPNYVIDEDKGIITITVQRVGGTQGELKINYTTIEGSAAPGQDYNRTASTLVWREGDTQDKTISIAIFADAEDETVENFSVQLYNASGGVVDMTDVAINNVEANSSVQFALASYTVNETDNKVKMLVTRASSNVSEISVNYATVDGTATANADYVPQQGILKWADGEAQHKIIEIPLLLDETTEGNEIFSIVLSDFVGKGELGKQNQSTVTIIDTPAAGVLQFAQSEYTAKEGEKMAISAERVGGKTGEVKVNYTTLNNTATAGTDYTMIKGELVWTDGDVEAKPLTIDLATDTLEEGQENFLLVMSDPIGGAGLSAQANINLYIQDVFGTPTTTTPKPDDPDDPDVPIPDPVPQPGTLQFEADNYHVSENDGLVTIGVSRLNGSDGIVGISYTMTDGTAVTGKEYISQPSKLLWQDGDSAKKSFTVGIYDDGVIDGSKSFTIQLLDPIGGATVGLIDNTVVAIQDDDTTSVHLASNTYVVDENAGKVTIKVQRQEGKVGSVAVKYTTKNDTAVQYQDYTPMQGKVEWTHGDMQDKTIVIPIVDNATKEGNRTFQVVLSGLTGNATLTEPKIATITIVDNDDAKNCTIDQSVGCYYNNAGTMTNTIILPLGTVVGGKLSGHIFNDGVVQDVVLLANSILDGGVVRGKLYSDPKARARLVNVKVIGNAQLRDIIIGPGCILDNTVTLGVGVSFENNATIPSVNLATVLGKRKVGVLGQYAINLESDLLLYPAIDGILGALNGLYEYKSRDYRFIQHPTTGYLELDTDRGHYVLLPTQVKQILRYQVIAEMPLGVTESPDGSVVFVTHTGREITAYPVAQNPTALAQGLMAFNLPTVTMQTNGNLLVPVTNEIYYNARPDPYSQLTYESGEGIFAQSATFMTNFGVVYLVYLDESGKKRQQFFYSAPAAPEALYALESDSHTKIYNDGRITAFIGKGADKKTYSGVVDYVVYKGTATTNGKLQFVDIEDKNGDSLPDYEIVYPNGDRQIMYRLPN